MACFVVFYLLIPFLNLLIQTMNSKLHLRLILLCLLVYSVIGTIPKITLGVNYVSWFVVLYFIASYIRLYRFPIKISNRNWGWLTLLSILISMASVVFMAWLSTVFVNKIYLCFGLWLIVIILWLWLLLFARLCFQGPEYKIQ